MARTRLHTWEEVGDTYYQQIQAFSPPVQSFRGNKARAPGGPSLLPSVHPQPPAAPLPQPPARPACAPVSTDKFACENGSETVEQGQDLDVLLQPALKMSAWYVQMRWVKGCCL